MPHEDNERRRSDLLRRRQGIAFEVDQGELASFANNPWQKRIDLLTQALATVESEIASLENAPGQPKPELPTIPITSIQVDDGTPSVVKFDIGAEHFHYEEEIDWSERGHQVVQAELQHEAGDPAALVPSDLPADQREAMRLHLTGSLFVFATDLRDRSLAGDPPPTLPALADLATPCPSCGGWTDWRGRCLACTQRDNAMARLREESHRLMSERAQEIEDQNRHLERLSVARRRLADIDAALGALNVPPA